MLKVTVVAALLILVSGAFMAAGLGQTPSKTLTPEEQDLLKAQKANEEAQAEYYREQTNKLRQPAPKSFTQSVYDNPASVVGVVGTILGAIIVALVSLTTLYYNSRNSIRAQQDSQFYEAMKRMGDEDSPTLRASAASLVALMAHQEWGKLALSEEPPLLELKKWKPYFNTAVNQLLTGHLLETNSVATESIKKALQQLLPLVPDIDAITGELYIANLSFQNELASLIAEFFVVRGKPSDPAEVQKHKDLEQLESVIGFDSESLRKLISDNSSFTDRFATYQSIIDQQNNADRGQLRSALHDKLRMAAGHLRANVDVFCTALEKLQPKAFLDKPPDRFLFSFENVFLVGGHIKDANLSKINFTRANLKGMELQNVNLAYADLRKANLQAVKMVGGSLSNAQLSTADLDSAHFSQVDLTNAPWWEADFSKRDEATNKLLRYLYRHNKSVPDDLRNVHASVRPFLDSLRREK